MQQSKIIYIKHQPLKINMTLVTQNQTEQIFHSSLPIGKYL